MIENDLYRKQLEVKRLIDEGLDLKQSMITLVLSLTTFLHEETMADMHRKTEIKGHIQENILELLKKNRIHQTTKMRMRAAARGMSQLMDQMEVVEESKEIIEEVWAEAVEAANCM
jgi:predicted nucleic acid-binding protein